MGRVSAIVLDGEEMCKAQKRACSRPRVLYFEQVPGPGHPPPDMGKHDDLRGDFSKENHMR